MKIECEKSEINVAVFTRLWLGDLHLKLWAIIIRDDAQKFPEL
jgi:hypothetical protein